MTTPDHRHLLRAIALCEESAQAGCFPAGAVVVSQAGEVLAESISSPYPNLLHADGKAISAAHAKVGPLQGATLYVGMEPCLMCRAMAFWAEIGGIVFALKREAVNAAYYECPHTAAVTACAEFHRPIPMIEVPDYADKVLDSVRRWEAKFISLRT